MTQEQNRKLLARRDALARQLATLDAQIDAARRAYSFERGYRVPLRVEAFRREVAA